MAVDDDCQIALALRSRCSRGPGARLKPLGRGLGTTILRPHRTGFGYDLASLHLAPRIDCQRHHLAAEQCLAWLQIAGVGLRAWLEPPLESDSRILVLRARRCGLGSLAAEDIAGLGGIRLKTRFKPARLRLAVAGDRDGDFLPPWRAWKQCT